MHDKLPIQLSEVVTHLRVEGNGPHDEIQPSHNLAHNVEGSKVKNISWPCYIVDAGWQTVQSGPKSHTVMYICATTEGSTICVWLMHGHTFWTLSHWYHCQHKRKTVPISLHEQLWTPPLSASYWSVCLHKGQVPPEVGGGECCT